MPKEQSSTSTSGPKSQTDARTADSSRKVHSVQPVVELPPEKLLSALGKAITSWTNRASELLTIIVLLSAAVLAVVSVAEISSRNHARAQIDSIERDATREFLERLPSIKPQRTPVADSSKPSRESLDLYNQAWILMNIDASETIASRLKDDAYVRAEAMLARNRLDSLSVRGGQSQDETVNAILERLEVAANMKRGRLLADAGASGFSSTLGEPAISDKAVQPGTPANLSAWASVLQHLQGIGLARSDFLLALTVACCALVGAIVAGLRKGDARFNAVEFVLGLSSGFIAFIALRGGRSVFMLELHGDAPLFNPYSMAFAGLLVGLFTSKAYELLTVLIDDLSQRIRSAFGKPHQASTAGAVGISEGRDETQRSTPPASSGKEN